MEAREVMTAPAITIDPDTPFDEIVRVLIERDVSGLPVVDRRGTLVGIVTEADLVRKDADPGRRPRLLRVIAGLLTPGPSRRLRSEGLLARAIMTPFPMTARLDEGVDRLAQRMLEHGINRLPVVAHGRVEGIVTRHDLLRAFDRRADLMAGAAAATRFPDPMRVLRDQRVS